MVILHIEHAIRDFASWKKAFDNDPAGRQRSGVLRYQVLQPVDDPNYVMIDLYFESATVAENFLTAMRQIWQSATAASVLGGGPQTRIVAIVESEEY